MYVIFIVSSGFSYTFVVACNYVLSDYNWRA
uniref:Uncharacterized protein n=1 Tax=Arundo donax TaxID=35708 RepID=A0A0A9GNU0_ARUDO